MFLAERSCRKCASNSSAGGQLEQPSEVNSSTTTALRGGPGSEVLANSTRQIEITATARIASAKIRLMRIRLPSFLFVANVSRIHEYLLKPTTKYQLPNSAPHSFTAIPSVFILRYKWLRSSPRTSAARV